MSCDCPRFARLPIPGHRSAYFEKAGFKTAGFVPEIERLLCSRSCETTIRAV
jgi:hypothetical protein